MRTTSRLPRRAPPPTPPPAEARLLTVALVASSFLPRFGGVEEHVLNVARVLRDRGTRVVIWAVDQHDDGAPATVDGIPVRYLPCPLPARSAAAAGRFLIAAPGAAARWLAAFRADRPDALHVHCFGPNGAYATALATLTRTPVVLSSHGETFMDASGAFDSPLLRRALRIGLRRAAAVTVCSDYTARHLEEHYDLAPGRAGTVYNGIDLAEPGGPAPEWLPEDYVLAVGRHVPNKGFDLLLEAFAQADVPPATRLVIGGDGPERPALAARAERLGLTGRVILPGRLSRPEVVTVMARARVLVVPSRVEAFGITVLEGWRAGIPVIATSHGGPPEFVADGRTGVLVDPADTQTLAAAMARVLSDPEYAARLGAAGRTAVAGFTWTHAAQQYEAVYAGLSGRRRTARRRRTVTSRRG